MSALADGGMSLAEAMDVFDMSALRTTPNRQTEAWTIIRAKLTEAAAELRRGEWMDIESAPRDGAAVILGRAGDDERPGTVREGYWQDAEEDGVDYIGADGGFVDLHFSHFHPGRSFGADAYRSAGSQPTHWQPLPAAPAAARTDEGE